MERKAIVWWEWLLLALLTLAAGWLRWHDLDAKSIWLDEAFSIWMARQPLTDLFGWLVQIDQHPPLFYILLHGWRNLGEEEATIRAMSALFSTATIPVMYLLARRLLGVASAITATVLLVVSPFHMRFAQEARMYALLVFNACMALLALAYLLAGDHRQRWFVLYAIFMALTLLSHNTAVLFFIAVNLAVLALLIFARKPGATLHPPAWRSWLLAQVGALVLWLPWASSFYRQVVAVDNEFWIQPPTRNVILEAIWTLFSDWRPWGNTWIPMVALAALLLGILALLRRPALLTFLLLLIVTPFALELLISLRRPIFYDRTLIWTTIPLFILLSAAVGAWLEQRSWWRLLAAPGVVVLGLLLWGNRLSLENYFDNFHKEQWREAAAYVATRTGPNDMLLFNATWIQLPFEYYYDRAGKATPKHGAPVDLFDAGILEPKMTPEDVPRLEEIVQGHDCVWLIYSHNWYTDPKSIVPKTMRSAMAHVDNTDFVGLQVQLYGRHGGRGCGKVQP